MASRRIAYAKQYTAKEALELLGKLVLTSKLRTVKKAVASTSLLLKKFISSEWGKWTRTGGWLISMWLMARAWRKNGKDSDHPTSRRNNNTKINKLEDVPGSVERDFYSSWCRNFLIIIIMDIYSVQHHDQDRSTRMSSSADFVTCIPWEECRSFDLYWLFTHIESVKSINIYPRQAIDQGKKSAIPVTQRSHINAWRPVIISKLTNFLAVTVHMSVVHKSKLVNYCILCSLQLTCLIL